jgi:hypothetical protein
MVSVLERSATKNGSPRRVTAQATAALCVGGMVVARAMLNRQHADDLRDACMAVALQLGGWDAVRAKKNASATRKPRGRSKSA